MRQIVRNSDQLLQAQDTGGNFVDHRTKQSLLLLWILSMIMVDEKLKDGENKSTENRTAVALEILKIGVRVLKKKMNKMAIKILP